MKISIFFLLGMALILMASVEDCNGRIVPAAVEAEGTIQGMDLLFPASHDSNSNAVNKFSSHIKIRTTTEAPEKGEEQEPAPRAAIVAQTRWGNRPLGLMPRPIIAPYPGFHPILHHVITNIANNLINFGKMPITNRPLPNKPAKRTTTTTTTPEPEPETPEPETEPAEPQAPAEPEPSE